MQAGGGGVRWGIGHTACTERGVARPQTQRAPGSARRSARKPTICGTQTLPEIINLRIWFRFNDRVFWDAHLQKPRHMHKNSGQMLCRQLLPGRIRPTTLLHITVTARASIAALRIVNARLLSAEGQAPKRVTRGLLTLRYPTRPYERATSSFTLHCRQISSNLMTSCSLICNCEKISCMLPICFKPD